MTLEQSLKQTSHFQSSIEPNNGFSVSKFTDNATTNGLDKKHWIFFIQKLSVIKILLLSLFEWRKIEIKNYNTKSWSAELDFRNEYPAVNKCLENIFTIEIFFPSLTLARCKIQKLKKKWLWLINIQYLYHEQKYYQKTERATEFLAVSATKSFCR